MHLNVSRVIWLVKGKPQYKGKNKLTANTRIRLTRDAIIMRSKNDKIKAAILLQEDIVQCTVLAFTVGVGLDTAE